MRKYTWIMVLSIPLILLLLLFLFLAGDTVTIRRPLADRLHFVLTSEDGISKTISSWTNDSGELVVFLPSYAKLSALTMEPVGNKTIRLAGTELKSGMDCSHLRLNTSYSLTDGTDETTIQFIRSANAAAMYVETATGSMRAVHKDKSIRENAEVQLFTEKGVLDYSGDGIGLERHKETGAWK